MVKLAILIVVLLISNIAYSQKQTDFDSLETVIRKSHRGVQKLSRLRNDSSTIIVAYNKSSFKLFGVQILQTTASVEARFSHAAQFAFYFVSDDTVLLSVLAKDSVGRHFGRAKYLFKGEELVAKEEDKYIKHDYSNLITRYSFYKHLALQHISEKIKRP